MAGLANLSSSFCITLFPTNFGAGNKTRIVPGRACRVIGVAIINNTAGAETITVEKATSADVLTAITQGANYSAAANTTSWADLDLSSAALTELTSTDNLLVEVSVAGIQLEILCVATGGGATLATSNSAL